jgi:hypothetical protein
VPTAVDLAIRDAPISVQKQVQRLRGEGRQRCTNEVEGPHQEVGQPHRREHGHQLDGIRTSPCPPCRNPRVVRGRQLMHRANVRRTSTHGSPASELLPKLYGLGYVIEVDAEQVCARWQGECPPPQTIVFPLLVEAQAAKRTFWRPLPGRS